MLRKFRETKHQGGRNRVREGQDSAGFEKRSECKKEGPEGRAVMSLSTGEVGTGRAQTTEEEGLRGEGTCV